MGTVLQGLAGFIYLVFTTGCAITLVVAYNDGAATIAQLERFALSALSDWDPNLVFYALVFLVWLFVTIPAFRLLGEAERGDWQSQMSAKMVKLEKEIAERSKLDEETLQVLRAIRIELKDR